MGTDAVCWVTEAEYGLTVGIYHVVMISKECGIVPLFTNYVTVDSLEVFPSGVLPIIVLEVQNVVGRTIVLTINLDVHVEEGRNIIEVNVGF